MQKGDLVILQQDSAEAYATGWCYGENDRTGKKGDFPAESVYLLPTMSKPPADILVSLFAYFIRSKNDSIISISSNCLLCNRLKKLTKSLQLINFSSRSHKTTKDTHLSNILMIILGNKSFNCLNCFFLMT